MHVNVASKLEGSYLGAGTNDLGPMNCDLYHKRDSISSSLLSGGGQDDIYMYIFGAREKESNIVIVEYRSGELIPWSRF